MSNYNKGDLFTISHGGKYLFALNEGYPNIFTRSNIFASAGEAVIILSTAPDVGYLGDYGHGKFGNNNHFIKVHTKNGTGWALPEWLKPMSEWVIKPMS
jgi:hypothetical protein